MRLPKSRLRMGLIAAAVTAAAVVAGSLLYSPAKRQPDLLHQRVKSANLSVDYTVEQALSDAKRLSLNTVNVPVMVIIDQLNSSTMKLDPGSMKKAQTVMKELKKRNIHIILEPYPWIGGGEFYETDWNPADVELFFTNWTDVVLKPLADEVAVPEGADALCIASNFTHLERYEDRWVQLAATVKERFPGLITYKTNWWYTADWDEASQRAFQEKLKRPIFGKVDFISIAAYFELSDRPTNTVSQLKEALQSSTVFERKQNIVAEIEQLHMKWNKPIFLGELGFPKRNYAAKQPWNPSPSNVFNGEEQARGFEAYRQVFTQDWFLGFSVFAVGDKGEDKHYYPSDESAAVIRKWFD